MGRPKTKRPADHGGGGGGGSALSSPPAMAARRHQRRSFAAPGGGSSNLFELPPSAGSPVAVETPSVSEMESWFRNTGLDHVMVSDSAAVLVDGMDGVVNGTLEDAARSAHRQRQAESQALTMMDAAEEMAVGGYCGNAPTMDETPGSGLLASNMGLAGSSSLPHSSSASTFPHHWNTKSPLRPSDVMELNSQFSAVHAQVEDSEREEHDGRGGQGHCYIRILRRLTQLEETLERSPPTPSLDVILSAERDTRVLKDTLFACGGHPPTNILGFGSADGERSRGMASQACLQTQSSSLVVLALLADRVTSLLEGLFQQAAASSYGIHRAFQTSSASLLLGSTSPEMTNYKGEWRMARSLRGSLPRSINCPVPEASCRLTIGKYEVDNEVESRVMKHILRRRIRALQRMLGELEEHLEPSSGGRRASRASQDGPHGRAEGERPASLLGDKGGRRGFAPTMARTMVLDVRRRVELLQGRLELAE